VTRARGVHHAGLAWAAAFAGAWLVAASCRTTRDVALEPPAPGRATPTAAVAGLERPIRVGIRVAVEQSTLAAPSGVVVRGAAFGEDVTLLRSLTRASFRASGPGRIRLIETGDELESAHVAPAAAGERVAADASPYRGVMDVLPAEGARLTVVNVVPLEEYLRGVVPNELAPEAFPQVEAQKAQAVAARSYALAHLGDYASRGYDLCATPACQVYRGTESEHVLSDRAVAETRGVVASWRGRPIHAFYTSTCGGHTEDGTAVFEDGAPYLRGVACPAGDDPEGRRPERGRSWEVRLGPDQAARRIARYGDVGRVLDLVPTRVGVSGRVVELRIVGSDGELALRGQRVRLGLGLRESLFVVHREEGPGGEVERFVFRGRGWGHGVGLCQFGAATMARSGASFDAILKHYYTGVAVAALGAPAAAALGAP
jgi:stage II sporulation protein D